MMLIGELGDLTLSEVWPVWWEQKKQEIGPKTAKCYGEYQKPLLAFFPPEDHFRTFSPMRLKETTFVNRWSHSYRKEH
jgi:hypothetical protein